MQPEQRFNPGHPSGELSLFDQKPRLLLVSMVVILVLAGAVRLYRINAPGVLVSRDYTSAIFARDFYFENTDSVEQWQKEIAHITRQNQPILEPPVTEYLVSLIYRAAGSERIWFARLLTLSFWLAGGIFLYKSAKIVVSTDAAVFAAAYYLFLPLSVLLSRSFQPDSLMMLLYLISLYGLTRYYERPSDLRLVIAASVSGLTLLYRPLVIFTLFGAFIALAIYQKGTWKRVVDRHFLIFVALSLLPPVLYYGYGILFAGFLRWKVETSFRLWLLQRPEFWKGWLDLAGSAVGHTALIGALIGLPMLRQGFSRALVIGLGIGYVAFGLAFNMHIHTHGYYQAQLIPVVAISLGPVVTLIATRLKQTSNRWYWWLPTLGVLLLVSYLGFREIRTGLDQNAYSFESEKTAREIGEIVGHSSQAVFLAPKYGLPLQYYGELTGAYWPRRAEYYLERRLGDRELNIEQRLDALDFSPEYFIITDFNEFNRHHADLEEYLVNNCALVTGNDRYLIYDTCAQQ